MFCRFFISLSKRYLAVCMKTIKIQFLDFYRGFFDYIENDLFVRILKKHFDLQICDDPDYVIYSVFGERHWRVPDRCVKIFYTGENLAPDFNACDYGIGFEWMDYQDRYFRFPFYLRVDKPTLDKMEHKHELPSDWDIRTEKPDFCSFVVSNPQNTVRNAAFARLNEYKHVNSGGKYMNNVGGPVQDKLAFDSRHKFSLCYENGRHDGYTTEKIVQAFAARTVPIYWGDPTISRVFNPDAFINVSDYNSFEEVMEYIKFLDHNDDAYLKMLRAPAMLPTQPSIDEQLESFEKWFVGIFEQPLEEAYRRSRFMHGKDYTEKRKLLSFFYRNRMMKVLIKRLLK